MEAQVAKPLRLTANQYRSKAPMTAAYMVRQYGNKVDAEQVARFHHDELPEESPERAFWRLVIAAIKRNQEPKKRTYTPGPRKKGDKIAKTIYVDDVEYKQVINFIGRIRAGWDGKTP